MGGGACFGLTLLTSLYVGTIFLGTAQHVIKSHVNSTLELVGGSLTPPPPPRGCDASPVQVTSSRLIFSQASLTVQHCPFIFLIGKTLFENKVAKSFLC